MMDRPTDRCKGGGGGKYIHARVMVLVHDTSSECTLQMYRVLLEYL